MMENNPIKKFCISFFKNMRADLEENNSSLIVKKVPKEFEDFYGKKSPYKLIFDRAHEDSESELMIKGSYLLKMMIQYLERKAKKTLIKIKFDLDLNNLLKENFNLRNCEVYSFSKKEDFREIYRFSFLTNFKYLNEREQVMNSIFVKSGEVIDFNLESYDYEQGKNKDIPNDEIKENYIIAREKVKEIVQPRIVELSKELGDKLENEKTRIGIHYSQLLKESEEEAQKLKSQIIDLNVNLKEADIGIYKSLKIKIERLKTNLDAIEKGTRREDLLREKEFFIKDETFKHSLDIDNKLMNTSIIYYPFITYNIILKNNIGGNRQIRISYDPIDKKISHVNCDTCNKEIKELILLSCSHICCEECRQVCKNCNLQVCKNCLDKTCESCKKLICKNCLERCQKCGKGHCKNHLMKDSFSGKSACLNCLKKCAGCNGHTEKINFEICKGCGRGCCKKCIKKGLVDGRLKIYCVRCSKV